MQVSIEARHSGQAGINPRIQVGRYSSQAVTQVGIQARQAYRTGRYSVHAAGRHSGLVGKD